MLVAAAQHACTEDPTGEPTQQLIAVTKVVASHAAEQAILTARERCGAQGMFSSNKIADYIALGHLVITSEGDNHVIGLKVGQQMAMKSGYLPPDPGHRPNGDLHNPALWRWCLRSREAGLHAQISDRVTEHFQAGTSSFTLWDDLSPQLLTLVTAHGARLAAETALASSSESDEHANALTALFALHTIQTDIGSYLTQRILTADDAEELTAAIDGTYTQLSQSLASLSDSLDIPYRHLHAPIAGDYLASYDHTGPHPLGTAQYARNPFADGSATTAETLS